jgi:hypothetical protein
MLGSSEELVCGVSGIDAGAGAAVSPEGKSAGEGRGCGGTVIS